MKFFILLKKDKFKNNLINDSILSSTNAPSLISNNFIKKDFKTFSIYMYTYNHIYKEIENKYYKIDDSGVSLLNGLISIEDTDEFNDIDEIFDALRNNKSIIGDFQAIRIDDNGDNIIKTSITSIFPLFYYEDEYCSVISNELKLIVDGIKKFSDNKFVDFYDFNYIHDLFVLRGSPKRVSLRNTVFKNIRRILPFDEIFIDNNQVKIKENDKIDIPESFEELYLNNHDKFYDWYFDSLMHYANSLIKQISADVDGVNVPITGGFDSRLQLMIFSKLAPKYGINIQSHTSGSAGHPDVIVGEKVAKSLNIDWKRLGGNETAGKVFHRHLPQHFNEYASTFYASQGDFDSHDYIIYSREIKNPNEFSQLGNNMYKQEEIHLLARHNGWYSRRILFKGDFFFPLFSTSYELYIAQLNNKYHPGEKYYKDFVYNVIKRCEPKLLEMPFANDFLPQVDVDEFKSEDYVGSIHKAKPFLYDYYFVLNELNTLFKPQFDKKDDEFNNILSKLSINSLDYFILKDKIDKLLDDSSQIDDDLKIKLIELKENSFYPKTRSFIDLNNSKNYYRDASLLKLMDLAAAASFSSFEELEMACEFSGSSNDILNVKEEVYGQIADTKNDNLALEYKNTIRKLKNSLKFNEELLSSNSWKATKPLRSFKKVLKR